MSFMCCVYLPEGIVMAADSRITNESIVSNEIDGKEYVTKTKYTLSDNGQKVFLLSKVKCGITFCGKFSIFAHNNPSHSSGSHTIGSPT